jgi:hypothetical protein
MKIDDGVGEKGSRGKQQQDGRNQPANIATLINAGHAQRLDHPSAQRKKIVR